jgi:hypothetical protein
MGRVAFMTEIVVGMRGSWEDFATRTSLQVSTITKYTTNQDSRAHLARKLLVVQNLEQTKCALLICG